PSNARSKAWCLTSLATAQHGPRPIDQDSRSDAPLGPPAADRSEDEAVARNCQRIGPNRSPRRTAPRPCVMLMDGVFECQSAFGPNFHSQNSLIHRSARFFIKPVPQL